MNAIRRGAARARKTYTERTARSCPGVPARRRWLLALLLLLLTTPCAACGHTKTAKRGILFVGPVFYTGTAAVPLARGVEVDSDGRITKLHERAPTATSLQRVVLSGAFAVPGLHDAHLHLQSIGRVKERVDLRGTTSIVALVAKIRAFAKRNPSLSVITGRGWDQSRWPSKRFPTWRDIEGVSDKPILVRRVDGHAALANRAMLTLAGITKQTKPPDGGQILHDASGEPTGVLIDRAMELARKKVADTSPADKRRWIRAGANACADAGMTAVHDMGASVAGLRAIVAEDRAKPLPLRVFIYLDGDDTEALTWLRKHRKERTVSPRITVMGIKLFADGAMGSRGAALLQPYSDAPTSSGLIITPSRELSRRAWAIHQLGGQVAIHAIGDRGNRIALDALAHAQGADITRKHRVEHAQLLHDADIPRFAELNVTASMQPTHATSDMRWALQRVGEARLAGAYAWRRILASGALVAFGSDAPVEDERILRGLHAATTRTDVNGLPAGGWRSDQKLTDSEAIAAFTHGPAVAVHRGSELGKLAPGYLFDVTLLNGDPRGVVGRWLKVQVTGTALNGTVRTTTARSK